jgi:hypothetical protein
MAVDERTPTGGRGCSAESELLFNAAAGLNALAVEVARSAGLLDRLAGPERSAFVAALCRQIGVATETLHDFRRLVGEL